MANAPLDDGLHSNAKMVGLTHDEFRLWTVALSWLYGDGHDAERTYTLPKHIATGLAAMHRCQKKAISGLVSKGCWHVTDGGGYRFHDAEKHDYRTPSNLSAVRSEAGRKGMASRWGRDNKPDNKPVANPPEPDSTTAPGVTVPARYREPVPPVPSGTGTLSKPPVSDRVRAADIEAVFDAYCESTNRTATYARTPERRALIAKALKVYPLAEVLDAVDGWRFVAHNRGENDRGRPFHDLELLLRDAKHIETFRDAKRGQLSSGATLARPVQTLRSIDDVLAEQDALLAEAEA